MIKRTFLERLGLTEEQIIPLMEIIEKEAKYRKLLYQEKVMPSAVEAIISVTDIENMDLSNEALIREKISIQYSDFIPRK